MGWRPRQGTNDELRLIGETMADTDAIVLSPDGRLFTKCAPVEKIDDSTRRLADRMLRIMYAADGCGLAASQIGEMVRMVVIDCDYGAGERNPYVLINPEIIRADGEVETMAEGCLSFPGITVPVDRPSHVVVHARDLDGDLMEYEAEHNLMCVCLQHEIDHLDGTTMVDHLPPSKRARALSDCERAIAEGVRPGETD